ncbi:MAG: NAD-dependent epimerase/dehydratase family protein, partial [Deltaproteobacteria bacterium]|nr:NAD-dependent epimerase/dehydratase family protein [Deltaproteobacteria bacterium]
VVRNPRRVPGLRERGVELRQADLGDCKSLTAGFHGVDAVVSNAALFAVGKMLSIGPGNWKEHEETNVRGTRNVFDAIVSAGVKRVVQVSSVAVYAGGAPSLIDEDHPQLSKESWHTPFNAYQISKALSEQLAWQLAQQNNIELTTVRPCAIYGAFDPNFTVWAKRLLALPITVFPSRLHLPLVYGGDVAEGIALALEKPVSVGRAYNLTGDDRSIWEFLEAWREAGGRCAAWSLPVPVPYAQRLDHSRATHDLGWRNRPFVDALRETFALEANAGI